MLTKLERRILDISYRHKLSHLGSCLGAVGVLDDIYTVRRDEDPVILSCGHAGLALYVVLEKHLGLDAEELFIKYGIHPTRDANNDIWCSTGSLGQGITVAVGMALADKNRDVYCVVSDGEASEGSYYEAIRFANEQELFNLRIIGLANGYSAYRNVDFRMTSYSSQGSWKRVDLTRFPFLHGLDAHYYVMNDSDYAWVTSQEVES